MSENIEVKQNKQRKKRDFHNKDLIAAIQARTNYSEEVVERVLKVFVDEIPKILVDHGSLVVMNLGTLTLKKRDNSINPRTKAPLNKPCVCPTFKQSKNFKNALIREQGVAKDKLLNGED